MERPTQRSTLNRQILLLLLLYIHCNPWYSINKEDTMNARRFQVSKGVEVRILPNNHFLAGFIIIIIIIINIDNELATKCVSLILIIIYKLSFYFTANVTMRTAYINTTINPHIFIVCCEKYC
jgi:hypothetical protein